MPSLARPPPAERPVRPGLPAHALHLMLVLGFATACRPGPSGDAKGSPTVPATAAAPARHVGSAACRRCHETAFAAWQGSHHARAIQPAREDTVAGDFGGATFPHRGKTWRFFRDGARFMVHAEGPDGAMRDYQVTHTFGVEPLQQYLVPFPGGRLQALSAAWDTGRRRWFHVDPGPVAPPGDWLHWTRPGQGWNGMCADCHSTAVAKGYDPEADSYATTQAELGVGCEACHGPGSAHLTWAEAPADRRPALPHAGFPVQTRLLPASRQLALCAPCHSRRSQFADQGTPGGELLDRYLPTLLSPGLFHADGQIEDETFEWHAFGQSRMAARGVRCQDCHDVHSGKHPVQGNALCTRCHAAPTYDAPAHHHHRAEVRGQPGPGAQCVACHMPGRNYMVVHFRRDHSLRIPRPDLTPVTGAPNACNAAGCHADRSPAWAAARLDAWWPGARRPHPGVALAAGRARDPAAVSDLVRLAADREGSAPVVRATALEVLASFATPASGSALEAGLSDAEPLVRVTAARLVPLTVPGSAARLLGPLLRDPVRAVRAQAAARLAGPAAGALDAAGRASHAAALREHVDGQRYLSDLPSGPFNLANLEVAQGRPAEAERLLRRALTIDDRFFPAQVNLAAMLAGQGRLAEAEALLRAAHAQQPRNAGVAYDLGLLLAEAGKPADAEKALRDAWRSDPSFAPAALNLAVLVGERDPAEAVRLARRAAALRPDDARAAFTLGYYQVRSGDLRGATATLEALLRRDPSHPDANGLLAEIRARQRRTTTGAPPPRSPPPPRRAAPRRRPPRRAWGPDRAAG